MDYLEDWNNNLFKENGENSFKIKSQCKPIGIEKLYLNEYKISIRVSAKILNSNYKKGFNLNTLDQLNYELENKCGLKLNPNYLRDTKVNLVHVKNDVEVDPYLLKNELMLIGQSNKYRKVERENSITYECKNKTEKSGVRVYAKYVEILDNKSKYKGLEFNPNDFKDLTRIESFYNDWKTVAKYFGKERNLINILEQTNINYITILNLIKNQPMEIPQTNLSQFKTLSEIKEYAMFKVLFDACNGSEIAIKQELKSRLGENTKPSYQYKRLSKYLPLIREPKGRQLTTIKRTKELLKET